MTSTPSGYKFQQFEGLQIATVMPRNWQYWRVNANHFMAQQRIDLDGETLYETGLTLNQLTQMPRIPFDADAVARTFAVRPPTPNFTPLGDRQVLQTNRLAIHHRQFYTPASVLHGETRYYFAGVSDPSTNSVYTAVFETPAEQWKTMRNVAWTMIKNIHLAG